MTNGYWLPKIGSTSYSYWISGDSISVIDGLSSSMEGGTYYFRFDESISSCMMCEFYDYQGKKFVWTPANINDFQKNAKKVKIVWERKLM